jgi:hypothetical protein
MERASLYLENYFVKISYVIIFRLRKIKLSVDYSLLMTEKELMLLRTHGFRNANRNAGAPHELSAFHRHLGL